jgi:Helix-turn-helix domain
VSAPVHPKAALRLACEALQALPVNVPGLRSSPLARSAVLALLWARTGPNDAGARPSQQTIARALGCSVRTVQRAAVDLERLGAITRERPDRRARFTRATTRYTLTVRPSSSRPSSSRPSKFSRISSEPAPDWWDAHCAERWALDMPGIRITAEASEEVWLPADDAPDGVATTPCGVLPGPVPPDVRELAEGMRAAGTVVPPGVGAVEAVEASARLALETRGAVTETVGVVSRVAEVAAMEAARVVALRARRAAWLARMALALAVLFGGLYGAGTVQDYLTGREAFRKLEPVDQAEVDQLAVDQLAVDQAEVDQLAVDQLAVDQAEVDQLAVDQLEVDQAEVDQLAVDLHTFPGVTVSHKGSLQSRSSGARVARALFGSARTPDPDTPPTVPRPSGRKLLGPDRETRCDTS